MPPAFPTHAFPSLTLFFPLTFFNFSYGYLIYMDMYLFSLLFCHCPNSKSLSDIYSDLTFLSCRFPPTSPPTFSSGSFLTFQHFDWLLSSFFTPFIFASPSSSFTAAETTLTKLVPPRCFEQIYWSWVKAGHIENFGFVRCVCSWWINHIDNWKCTKIESVDENRFTIFVEKNLTHFLQRNFSGKDMAHFRILRVILDCLLQGSVFSIEYISGTAGAMYLIFFSLVLLQYLTWIHKPKRTIYTGTLIEFLHLITASRMWSRIGDDEDFTSAPV